MTSSVRFYLTVLFIALLIFALSCDEESDEPQEPYVYHPDTYEGVYHGNFDTKKLHHDGCSHYNCPECTISFNTCEEALDSGYIPCLICYACDSQ